MGPQGDPQQPKVSSILQSIYGTLPKNFLRYGQNAKIISKRYRDQPKRPLETAIYWVEYIARHNGAPHLHSAGQDLSFLAYHNLDILLAIIAIKAFFIIVIKLCCCRGSKKTQVVESRKGKKFN